MAVFGIDIQCIGETVETYKDVAKNFVLLCLIGFVKINWWQQSGPASCDGFEFKLLTFHLFVSASLCNNFTESRNSCILGGCTDL